MKRRLFLIGTVVFFGLILAAWFARPKPLSEQIERHGIHLFPLNKIKYSGGRFYEIEEKDAPKLRTFLYEAGFKTGTPDGGESDFGSWFVLDRRVFFFSRFQKVFLNDEAEPGSHRIILDINPD